MRLVNRLLAALLSLFLIITGVLLIIEVIADRIDHKPALMHWHPFYNWAGRTEWQAGAVRVICIMLILVGLVLLVAELKRPRVSRLRLTEGVSGIDTAYTRRGVAAAVKAAVGGVDGIRAVSVKVQRRKVKVVAMAGAQDKAAADNLKQPVISAAQDRLETLTLRSAPAVSVTVNPRSS